VSASAIEWTDQTWNPVTGCDRVSPGCAHCYALELAAKFKRWGQPRYQRDGGKASGPGFGVTLHEDKLEEPLHWRKPRRVFVNSMSDLFHEEIPYEFVHRAFVVMAQAHRHTFQVLTKRPERMLDLVRRIVPALPPPNIWLGVTIESRRFVDRADLLRETPAAVRFVSAEPLLGPLMPPIEDGCALPWPDTGSYWPPYLDLTDIDWLICGGESGPKARPLHLDWARDLRDACQANGTAFFFKQVGGRTPKSGGRELDGRTWDEMPTRAVAA
jgi:protein gp37